MKANTKILLIKLSIPFLILGACLGIEKFFSTKADDFSKKPIIVSKDNVSLPKVDEKPLEIVSKKNYGNVDGLSENLGFINDNEALVSIGISKEEFYNKYTKDIDKMSKEERNKAYKDINGGLYRLNLSTLEKKPLNIGTRDLLSDVLPNVYKLNYIKDDKCFVYDLKNDSNKVYENGANKQNANHKGDWSRDGNCLIVYQNQNLKVYDFKNNTSKEVKIKSDTIWINKSPGFYSEDGENIYFVGEEAKDKKLRYIRQGIFKVNRSSGKIEGVVVLPYQDTKNAANRSLNCIPSSDYTVLDGGKKILLSAVLEDKASSYIYDVDTKKFYTVVPHTVKSKEGQYDSPTWVSPDETKVIYMNRALENNKEQWNLYAAKINENNFTSRVCIAKDIEPGKIVQWSGDSKKALFFSGKNLSKKNGFDFLEKNEINMITFK